MCFQGNTQKPQICPTSLSQCCPKEDSQQTWYQSCRWSVYVHYYANFHVISPMLSTENAQKPLYKFAQVKYILVTDLAGILTSSLVCHTSFASNRLSLSDLPPRSADMRVNAITFRSLHHFQPPWQAYAGLCQPSSLTFNIIICLSTATNGIGMSLMVPVIIGNLVMLKFIEFLFTDHHLLQYL